MNTLEIAYVPSDFKHYYPERIALAINYISETNDPDIKGLIGFMSERIHGRRLIGKKPAEENGAIYMGGNSLDKRQCYRDAQILLARVILDTSSPLDREINNNYVKPQLENIAYGLYGRGNQDTFRNWIVAKKIYVERGLEYLEGLNFRQCEKSDEELRKILEKAEPFFRMEKEYRIIHNLIVKDINYSPLCR